MELIIGGVVALLLIAFGVWYFVRDHGGPDLSSGDWTIGDMDSTNEREGEER